MVLQQRMTFNYAENEVCNLVDVGFYKNCHFPLDLLKDCIRLFGVFWDVRAFSCCYFFRPLLATAGKLPTAFWKLHT
jgi:hypothetical protein